MSYQPEFKVNLSKGTCAYGWKLWLWMPGNPDSVRNKYPYWSLIGTKKTKKEAMLEGARLVSELEAEYR